MRFILAALGAAFLLVGCGEDRPVVAYKPGVYQGPQDQKLGDKERKEANERVKQAGRM